MSIRRTKTQEVSFASGSISCAWIRVYSYLRHTGANEDVAGPEGSSSFSFTWVSHRPPQKLPQSPAWGHPSLPVVITMA